MRAMPLLLALVAPLAGCVSLVESRYLFGTEFDAPGSVAILWPADETGESFQLLVQPAPRLVSEEERGGEFVSVPWKSRVGWLESTPEDLAQLEKLAAQIGPGDPTRAVWTVAFPTTSGPRRGA